MDKNSNKQKLVLHICCAPDEAWVVKSLYQQYELYCFFCNPNIQPSQEYNLRLEEAKRVAAYYHVAFAAAPYIPQQWNDAVRGFEHTPEKGQRCLHCFLLRLRRTALFCKDLGWKHFTTVMSVSPHKRIEMINTAGEQAAQEHSITFEKFNFKKNNGFLESIQLSKSLGLYRQDYCGCILSRQERARQRNTHTKK